MSRLPTTLGLVLLLVGTAAAQKKPVYQLPRPGGPFAVGTTTYHWVDESRSELLTDDPKDKRELMVQLWYPAVRATKHARPVGYVPGFATLQPLLKAQYGARSALLGRLRVPARRDTQPARKRKQWPVIVFSHGLRMSRFYYTMLLLELASHGYVVASLDHSYDVEGVVFPKKRLVRGQFGKALPKDATGASDPVGQRIRLWASDLRFVADQLQALAKGEIKGVLARHLDMKRLGVGGHCFGGMAALEAGLMDKRFKLAFAHNAWPPTAAVRKAGLQQPCMMLYSETTTSDEGLLAKGIKKELLKPAQEKRYRERTDGLEAFGVRAYQVLVPGSKHMDFSDMPTIAAWMMSDGKRMNLTAEHRTFVRYVLAFLDECLNAKKRKLLTQPAAKHEGVRFVAIPAKK